MLAKAPKLRTMDEKQLSILKRGTRSILPKCAQSKQDLPSTHQPYQCPAVNIRPFQRFKWMTKETHWKVFRWAGRTVISLFSIYFLFQGYLPPNQVMGTQEKYSQRLRMYVRSREGSLTAPTGYLGSVDSGHQGRRMEMGWKRTSLRFCMKLTTGACFSP